MKVQRFSAVEMMGVPIEDRKLLYSARGLLSMMSRYSIEGTEIPEELTEITPPYWDKNKYTYWLSQPDPNGPATVEMRPVYDDSQMNIVLGETPAGLVTVPYNLQRMVIPTDQEAFPLIGPSPRFAGQLCVHEVVSLVP
jgi:hypothetical protein